MDITKARKHLGKEASKYSDEEIQETINNFSVLADVIIDQVVSMTPEELIKLKERIKLEESKKTKLASNKD